MNVFVMDRFALFSSDWPQTEISRIDMDTGSFHERKSEDTTTTTRR